MQSAILPMYLRAKSVTVGAVVGKPKVGEIQPIKEGKMFNKRLSVLLAVVVLLIAAAFTINVSFTTPTLPSSDAVTNPSVLDGFGDTHIVAEPSSGASANPGVLDGFGDFHIIAEPSSGAAASDRTIDYSRMTGTYLPMQAF